MKRSPNTEKDVRGPTLWARWRERWQARHPTQTHSDLISLDELAVRIRQLNEFVTCDEFRRRRSRFLLDAAREELAFLRQNAYWQRYLKAQKHKDRLDWNAARDWVLSDEEETLSSMVETLARVIPRRPDEPMEVYLRKLTVIRERFRRSLMTETDFTEVEEVDDGA